MKAVPLRHDECSWSVSPVKCEWDDIKRGATPSPQSQHGESRCVGVLGAGRGGKNEMLCEDRQTFGENNRCPVTA